MSKILILDIREGTPNEGTAFRSRYLNLKTTISSEIVLKNFWITRPFLGIQFLTIDSEIQAAKNLPTDSGALVANVTDQSPAFNAGIKPGDIIIAINGAPLGKMLEIDSVLQKYQAGNQVMMKILRGKETLELPVILGSYK